MIMCQIGKCSKIFNLIFRVLFDQVEVTTAKAIPGHIYRIVNNSFVRISPNDRAYQVNFNI